MSEFINNVIQSVLKALYDGLYSMCNKAFSGMFNNFNQRIGNTSNVLRLTPEIWNSTAYNTVKAIAENAFVPIATCFIACILAWELVHLLQESNQMGGQIFEKLLVLLFTCVICVFLCSKSFDIVMFFFRLGENVTSKIAGTTVGTFGENLSIDSFLPRPQNEYTAALVFETAGDLILLGFANIIILGCSALIYIRVNIWFIEFLIYASAASIPNATWMNREWSQVGMNYTRKMLAVAFEGPFMLLLFSIYGGVVSGIGSGDFKESVIMIIGCGFALAGMMFKVGNISASIFNAH